MTVLGVDIETYSDIDIKEAGAYKYASSPNFEILLIAYAYDDDPVKLIDLTDILYFDNENERELAELLDDLTDPAIFNIPTFFG